MVSLRQAYPLYQLLSADLWEGSHHEPYLYVLNKDHLCSRCLAEEEVQGVLQEFHGSAYGGQLGAFKKVAKALQSGFWWPTMFKDAQGVVSRYYVSKWVEAVASPTNDSKVVVKLFKTIIFPRFGVPRVVISDGGSHFVNKTLEGLLKKHGVRHKYKALWAVKLLNFDIKAAQENRLLQLHELEEIRLNAYESCKIYKERKKTLHDQKILKKEFKEGDLVLLFNSRLKLYPGKIKSRWSDPFKILEVRSYGAVVL
ncbi:uncharacterized protein LOC112083517 [Eutrema salsugineum]|uniref:uncharacterized protein LOC112083517 n=1 Tax=Eutrema salsugineum TaxID=72664 RepID=UPI000CECF7FB|nr:uncharacterized protein LOC112083517 [Eutrema salsugineum]